MAPARPKGPDFDRASGPMLEVLQNQPCAELKAIDRPGSRKLRTVAPPLTYCSLPFSRTDCVLQSCSGLILMVHELYFYI
jgi:hypothetical protein